MRALEILVVHDERHDIWFVDSSEVPGLNVEAGSYDELVDIVKDVTPDLVDMNGPSGEPGSKISLSIKQVVSAPQSQGRDGVELISCD